MAFHLAQLAKLCNFALATAKQAVANRLERCRSGRSGRSRKPLNPLGFQGSNPCLSAESQSEDF